METNNLMIWFKSLCNVIVGSESPNYFTLVPGEAKTSFMETSDRNNNNELGLLSGSDTPHDSAKESNSTHHHLDTAEAKMIPTAVSLIPHADSDKQISNEEQSTTPASTTLPPEEARSSVHSDLTGNGQVASAEPDCDTMKYKDQPSTDLKSSPSKSELKSSQTIKSSKIITAIIDVIKSRKLFSRFDPFLSTKQQNFPISPLVNVCMKSCTITGFSNIEKTDNDGIIRYLGNSRFSIDCPIQVLDLRCEAQYSIKIGQKWHKRICLRNKTFTLKLDKCLIYVELKINTQTRTIRVERFSPISQQNVRCKAQPFSADSINHIFCKMLQRYFEKYFAANVLKLENQARRYMDRSAFLKYEDIVETSVLQKLFECFPASNPTSSLNVALDSTRTSQ